MKRGHRRRFGGAPADPKGSSPMASLEMRSRLAEGGDEVPLDFLDDFREKRPKRSHIASVVRGRGASWTRPSTARRAIRTRRPSLNTPGISPDRIRSSSAVTPIRSKRAVSARVRNRLSSVPLAILPPKYWKESLQNDPMVGDGPWHVKARHAWRVPRVSGTFSGESLCALFGHGGSPSAGRAARG